MTEPREGEEQKREVEQDGVIDWGAVPQWMKSQGKRRMEDMRHDAAAVMEKEEEEVIDEERSEPPRTEEGIMDEVLNGDNKLPPSSEAKPSRPSRKEKQSRRGRAERRPAREYPEAGEFLDFSPEEAAERWKEELERREREAAEAAARGTTRVFEAGGTPEEVYEAQVAGEDFKTKMRGAAKRALARAANAFSGFGAKFKGMFMEEDWSLPDEVVAERRRQIDEKWERAKKEGRVPDAWNKGDSSTSAAESGATPDKQEAAQTPRTPSENILFQLRENLDVQRRTLARITDNPEEAAKVQAKIEDLKEAIKKETGREELSPEEARAKAADLRIRIAALEARYKTAGKGVADHRARSYLDQLEENLDVQHRTLARLTDNPEEAAKVQAKIEELQAAIAEETGAALPQGEPETQGAIEREILALEKELYRCEGIATGDEHLELLAEVEARFRHQNFENLKNFEKKKTPEEERMVVLMDELINERIVRYGGTSSRIPLQNVHLLEERQWKEFHIQINNEDALKVNGVWSSTNQAVLIRRGESDDGFQKTVAHELVHSKMFRRFQKLDDRISRFAAWKAGISERGDEQSRFQGLNEAITEEIVKQTALRLPERKDFKEREDLQELHKKLKEAMKEGPEGKPQDPFSYAGEREVLSLLTKEISGKRKDDFASADAVFDRFAAAAIHGNTEEITKLVNDAFGEGAWEVAGDDSKNSGERLAILERRAQKIREGLPLEPEAAASSSPQTERATHPATSEEDARATVQKSFEALKRVPKDLELKRAQAEDAARQSVIDYVDANAAEAGRLVAEKREALKAQGVTGEALHKQLWAYVNGELRASIEVPVLAYLGRRPVKKIAKQLRAQEGFPKEFTAKVMKEIPEYRKSKNESDKEVASTEGKEAVTSKAPEAAPRPPSISEKEAWKSLKEVMKEYDKRAYSAIGEKAVNAALDAYVGALITKIEDMVTQRRIKVAGKPKHIQLMQEFLDETIKDELIKPTLEKLDKLGVSGTNRFPALDRLKEKIAELYEQN